MEFSYIRNVRRCEPGFDSTGFCPINNHRKARKGSPPSPYASREDVLEENWFLFALPHFTHCLQGGRCIKKFVDECDVKNPKALTSTKLCKHIATLLTVLNLKTNEHDQLADFLGHNIDVHRQHYRLLEGSLQMTKISKILLALEQGRLGEYKGKDLGQSHIDVNHI